MWIIVFALLFWLFKTGSKIAGDAAPAIDKVKEAIKQITYIPQNIFPGMDSRSENGVVYPDTPVLGDVYDPIFDWMKEHGYDINKGIKLYG